MVGIGYENQVFIAGCGDQLPFQSVEDTGVTQRGRQFTGNNLFPGVER